MARTGFDRFALILVIIGAYKLVVGGAVPFDIVALFGGATNLVSRIIYSVVGIAGIYSISLCSGTVLLTLGIITLNNNNMR